MKEITRYDIHEDWAHSGIIQAGNLLFQVDGIAYLAINF